MSGVSSTGWWPTMRSSPPRRSSPPGSRRGRPAPTPAPSGSSTPGSSPAWSSNWSSRRRSSRSSRPPATSSRASRPSWRSDRPASAVVDRSLTPRPCAARRRLSRPYTAGPVPGARIRRRLLLAVPAAAAGALLAAPQARAGLLFPESGGSPNADSIHTLYVMVFILALFIFAGVEGTLLYSLFKYKARRGRTAAQIHGNTKLEIGWTVGAAVILVFITAFTFIKLPAIKNPKPSLTGSQTAVVRDGDLVAATDRLSVKGPTLRITVNGQQYIWRFHYPGTANLLAYSDMVVPVGETVILDITADDVAHSWWIPKLGGKMDAVPGYTNRTWFRIP